MINRIFHCCCSFKTFNITGTNFAPTVLLFHLQHTENENNLKKSVDFQYIKLTHTGQTHDGALFATPLTFEYM